MVSAQVEREPDVAFLNRRETSRKPREKVLLAVPSFKEVIKRVKAVFACGICPLITIEG